MLWVLCDLYSGVHLSDGETERGFAVSVFRYDVRYFFFFLSLCASFFLASSNETFAFELRLRGWEVGCRLLLLLRPRSLLLSRLLP